jgi:hypothetical protein
MEKQEMTGILAFYNMAYRASCPEYSDIRVIPVKDEDSVKADPEVAKLLAEGYEIIDINAFGDISGRAASAVVLGKKG